MVSGLAEDDPLLMLGHTSAATSALAWRKHGPRAHLCFSALFVAAHAAPGGPAATAPLLLHLVATNRAELRAWYLGMQALSGVPAHERVGWGALLWAMARLRIRARGGARQLARTGCVQQ